MTDEALAMMARLWADGLTAKEIARAIGYSKSYVCELIHYNRDLFPYRLTRRSKDERKRWASLVIDGTYSYKQAAHHAGVHINTVKRWTKDAREGRL